jgi:hypothetical protein
LSTTIHAVVDASGNSLRLIPTSGEVAEIAQADALIEGVHPRMVVGDKGHAANA